MSPASAAVIKVRHATVDDLGVMHEIYSHCVLHDTASFELAPPALEEFARRFQAVGDDGLPWVVAEVGGVVKGYAYAALYRPRPAYRFTVEDSVYVAPSAQGQGLGHGLLSAVIEASAAMGKRQMVVVIAESVNSGSLPLHRKLGFRHVGTFSNVGFKFGRWLDTILMQRALDEDAASAS